MFIFILQMRKIEDARTLFERLVEQFPNAGKYWKLYIEQEVNIHFFCLAFHYLLFCLQSFCLFLFKYRFKTCLERIVYISYFCISLCPDDHE